MSFLRKGNPGKDYNFTDRFWSQVNKEGDCWIWQGYSSNGRYGHLKYNGRRWSAHETSYMLHHGLAERPKGLHILHRCDVTKCVNPDHLYAGTVKQNMRDALIRGRHGIAKLTLEEARWCLGKSAKEIITKFDIHIQHARALSRGRYWKGLL